MVLRPPARKALAGKAQSGEHAQRRRHEEQPLREERQRIEGEASAEKRPARLQRKGPDRQPNQADERDPPGAAIRRRGTEETQQQHY